MKNENMVELNKARTITGQMCMTTEEWQKSADYIGDMREACPTEDKGPSWQYREEKAF